MHMKKAQAAMEYLMTYGWAIIIVIIVAAALYAMGLFNPGTQAIATGFNNIGKPVPGGWQMLSDGNFVVLLANNAPYGVNVTSITVDAGATSCTGVQLNGQTVGGAGISIGMGGSFNVTGDCGTPIAGSSYTLDVSMAGVNDNSLDFRENGKVTGTVV